MNAPINLMPRIESKIREFALDLASKIGIEEVELDILLDDPEIHEALNQKAQAAIEDADKRRKQEILTAAKKKLGIDVKKPKEVSETVAPVIHQQPVESAWQKYLSDGNHSLPDSLTKLETHEEVSAARGFLIAVLNRHRQNADWIKVELKEAVGIWDSRAQKILSVINKFFGKKECIPRASSEVYSDVFSSIEGDSDLRWYLNGPASIQSEMDTKKNEQEVAQQAAVKRQQKKKALEAKKQGIIKLFVSKDFSGEDAEKLAAATIKKFPDSEIEEALLKMAVNRQVAAIQQNRDFLEKVASEAQPYLLGSGESENKFFLEVSQHTEVIALLKRDASDSKISRR